LTPFQIHILIGLSDCDGDGQVPYIEFAKICKEYIDLEFKFDTMCKKQNILKLVQSDDAPKTKHPANEEIDELEMFRVFKKYDRNGNGSLDFSEYTQCLAECPNMELSKNDIVTLALSADLNGDGVIDFEEFMKHYSDFLDMLEFNRNISK